MADTMKAQKLAAARKKLKEYQQKSQKSSNKVPDTAENASVCETLSSSTHSSINGNFDVADAVPSESTNTNYPTQVSPLHNYFNDNHSTAYYEESTNFFDNLTGSNPNSYNVSSRIDNMTINDKRHIEETNSMQLHFCGGDNGQFSPSVINENEDVRSLDDPKLKKNDIYGYSDKAESISHPTVSSEDAKRLSEYMQNQTDVISAQSYAESKPLEFHQHVEEFSSSDPNETNLLVNPQSNNQLHSNTESLRQLSSQLTELVKDNIPVESAVTSELESRNQELAALLDKERSEAYKLRTQLQSYQDRVCKLESELQQTKINAEQQLNREVGSLQEQLQCHAQTVGILVGEKTELSMALSQSQLLTKEKIAECEELQGRLKTSRSRVADLEKELQIFKLEKSKLAQHQAQEEDNHKLKMEIQELKAQNEEVIQDLLELREKLNIKANENLALQQELQEVTHQLSLAQVKIEQVTTGGNLQAESQVEVLTQQKLMLEKQVSEVSRTLKATSEERDQASVQYQQYVQQLNGQVASLASKLEALASENEALSSREQNLVRHISELEKHLQNIQEERLNFSSNKGNLAELKKELESTIENLEGLQLQKSKLEENYKQVLSEREDLLQEVESKKEIIEEMKNELERVRDNQPDSVKLLAAMESDKVAAARAVSQNLELKQQLEEMQQAFVRMSNDKLELTERLTSEEFRNKELVEKFDHVENQLRTLLDAIAIKDNELTQMRETLVHQNKQILQQDQLADRLRHYEAQDSSSHALQAELQKAQDQIHQLQRENFKLKQDLDNLPKIDVVHEQPKEGNVQHSNQNLAADVKSMSNHIDAACQTIDGEAQVLDLNILDKEVAMKHLEEKFTRTMADIANLIEEKQRLEHIVMQLQGETETIGEYIALYQHQRGILQQRTQEKDEQLKRLAQDREKIRSKLDMLNSLVKRLVLEKGVLTPEILEQHNKLNSQSHELCSEHAKIHQEINKIAEQSVPSVINTSNAQEAGHLNENNNLSTETAEEIIALLAEIKSSSLIQPSDALENFHPCPWCSGQLLTV